MVPVKNVRSDAPRQPLRAVKKETFMILSVEQLRCIPLFGGMTQKQLTLLTTIFEPVVLRDGEVLFEAGQPAEDFYLLTSGEVTISEGELIRYQLRPPASIGELGALAALTRNTTATISLPTELWRVSRERFLTFLESHSEVALPFYQTVLHLIADKVRRDQVRIEDMRKNIIRTQKSMKQMRDYLLESEETAVSESLHNTLEALIRSNRRANYRVKPPTTLPARLKLDGPTVSEVVQISRTHISFDLEQGPLPEDGLALSGVLSLGGLEIPISGEVLRTIERRVDLELDLLIDEYGAILDGYLTRIQMLDFMV
jgi:CRP/FNR family transcriptional regulator, cyclic AMP receptor protein